MTERALTDSIVKAIKRAHPDAWVFKVHGHPGQMVGVPDLLVCHRGHLTGLEVKFPQPGESADHARGRATTIQLVQLGAIERAGGFAAVVLSVQEALDVLRSIEDSLALCE